MLWLISHSCSADNLGPYVWHIRARARQNILRIGASNRHIQSRLESGQHAEAEGLLLPLILSNTLRSVLTWINTNQPNWPKRNGLTWINTNQPSLVQS